MLPNDHERKTAGYFGDDLWTMFAEENSSIRKVDENLIAGEIENMEKEFYAVQIDMEVFNKKNITEVMKSQVMPQVRKLFAYKKM